MLSDLQFVLQWWFAFFILGLIFVPSTFLIFSKFSDRGYLFSKVLGLATISYVLFMFNVLHVLPFGLPSIILVVWLAILFNFLFVKKKTELKKLPIKLIVFEEVLFLIGILIWSFVRAHEPSINGLEKFMDFGFVNSILRTTYQPAVDMWFPPLAINYYYFGHMATAIMTEFSLLPSNITFNLMIATLFSFCFTLCFSLSSNIISLVLNKKSFIGGLLTASLVTFAGNIHTIYTLFKAYDVNNPVPFWQLPFLPNSFPNAYWYPNATRFIPFTIHEFPIYSFVVSDLHGHVLDIPFVLLTISLTYVLLLSKDKKDILNFRLIKFENLFGGISAELGNLLIGFMIAVMYMTNVWDGLIYMLLAFLILLIKNWHSGKTTQTLLETLKPALIILISFFIFSLPFNIFFKPFASGIGILCAPSFLTNIGKIGPFLFEANHCQKSTWWELTTLYGFFYFFVISFFIFIYRLKKRTKFETSDIFALALIVVSTLLIIVPEFVYLKDIYPQHYRANTMFKLVYQSFMMLSITSGYIIVRILSIKKNILFFVPTAILLGFVFIYPYFAIFSYYNSLKDYTGLDGTKYLATKYPEDYAAINWINKNITGRPVMLEAQGDSYTDYERISANTGLPTILGWTVHEWLWRGSYNIPAPRIAEVQNIYTSADLNQTKQLLKKYDVKYLYIGQLEHEKYPNLDSAKFDKLGHVVFQNGNTKIYKLD